MEDITKYIKYVQTLKNTLKIILVCNVLGKTEINVDYQEDSVLGDYYTLSSFQEIKDGIKHLGFEVYSFFNENEFIKYILDHPQINKQDFCVISTAKTGIYPGRKSLIPAFCELNHIKYVGPDPYIISFAKDKYHWHLLLEKAGLRIPNYFLYDKYQWKFHNHPNEGQKVIAKLNNESCGIGLTAKNVDFYTQNYDLFLHNLYRIYSRPILVEEFISGKEVEVPVLLLNNKALAFTPCAIKMGDSFDLNDNILDYDTRKNDNYKFSPLDEYDEMLSVHLKETAIDVMTSLNIVGLGRVDFRINAHNHYFVTDIATTPFFSRNTSVRYGFEKMNYTYEDFLAILIYSAIEKSFPVIE